MARHCQDRRMFKLLGIAFAVAWTMTWGPWLVTAEKEEGRRNLDGDFDWEVVPQGGYPSIAFQDASDAKEVVFKYNFTGTTSPQKFLSSVVLDKNCKQPGDSSSFSIVQNISGNALEVDLDIVQENIAKSPHYNVNDLGTVATIDFCLHVDYNYKELATNDVKSINFHETAVSITVDLTANFTLTSITTSLTTPTEDLANSSLAYPVHAYFCEDTNAKVNASAYSPGSQLQFCIGIRRTGSEEVLVDDVLDFTISQPGAYPPTESSNPIVDSTADRLTKKNCEGEGVCNVKHQLASKWFEATDGRRLHSGILPDVPIDDAWTFIPNITPGGRRLAKPLPPPPLKVEGIAIVGFGIARPGNPGGRRQLRVPIRGIVHAGLRDRHLPASEESSFDLDVELVLPDEPPETDDGGGGHNRQVFLIIAVVVVVFLLGSCLLSVAYARHNKQATEEEDHQSVAQSKRTAETFDDDQSQLTDRYRTSTCRHRRAVEEENHQHHRVIIEAYDEDFDVETIDEEPDIPDEGGPTTIRVD